MTLVGDALAYCLAYSMCPSECPWHVTLDVWCTSPNSIRSPLSQHCHCRTTTTLVRHEKNSSRAQGQVCRTSGHHANTSGSCLDTIKSRPPFGSKIILFTDLARQEQLLYSKMTRYNRCRGIHPQLHVQRENSTCVPYIQ